MTVCPRPSTMNHQVGFATSFPPRQFQADLPRALERRDYGQYILPTAIKSDSFAFDSDQYAKLKSAAEVSMLIGAFTNCWASSDIKSI